MAPHVCADLSDVARLTEAATRPQVKAALAAMAVQMTERRRVQASTKASAPAGDKPLSSGDAASSAASAGTTPPPPPAVPSAAAGAGASAGAQPTAAGAGGGAVTTWRSLDKFAWDQSVKYVSVFVTLPGVGTQATVDVNTKFTGTSFELTITGYNGNENYRLVQAPLAKFIDPKRSKHKVKTDRVVVMLAKRDSEPPYGDTWYELRAKKGTKAAPKVSARPCWRAGMLGSMIWWLPMLTRCPRVLSALTHCAPCVHPCSSTTRRIRPLASWI